MAAAQGRRSSWADVVTLMRGDVRELGRMPGQASRFLQRYTSSIDALTAQLRRGWGLNGHEMQAISLLWEFGRMTMTELGQRIPLSRAAITTLTDRLERLGFVRRVPDPTDRRRILLEVTERVEDGFSRVHRRWNNRVDAYVEGIDDATWAAVVDVLADIRDLAREEADEVRSLSRVDIEREIGVSDAERSVDEPDVDDRPSWW